MLSIFCPYRNRKNVFEDFIYHYSNFYPEANIYMVEQCDESLFKRGQLANVIFNKLCKEGVLLDNILFVDIDLRIFNKIEFENMLDKHKTLVVPFSEIKLYTISGIGKYVPLNKISYFQKGDKLSGGMTLYTKKIFESCNGFSNVYVGWGCEDSDFLTRNNVAREQNIIMHIEHDRECRLNEISVHKNNIIFTTKKTDPKLDGYRQTTAQEVSYENISKNVYHFKVKNIGTIDNFLYKNYF